MSTLTTKKACACCKDELSWGQDPYHLTIIDIRSGNYVQNCKFTSTYVKPKDDDDAVADHIIELWEVKQTYFSIAGDLNLKPAKQVAKVGAEDKTYFDPEVKILDASRAQQLAWVARAWMPTTFADHVNTIYAIREIFNSSFNLCFTGKDFNSSKNKILMAKVVNPSDKKLLGQLRDYYKETQEGFDRICSVLVQTYFRTGCLVYWELGVRTLKARNQFLGSLPHN